MTGERRRTAGRPVRRSRRRVRADEAERRLRMLVVEDDRDLWPLVEGAVRQLDPSIVTEFAPDFRDASHRIEGGRRFDVVLADFLLADSENGWRLRSICRERQPDAAFAMTSSMPMRLPDLQSAPFLRKPYTMQECRRFVARLFGREEEPAHG